jgi:hypothetical protein
MKYLSLNIILLTLLLSCHSKNNNCDTRQFSELNLYPVSSILHIPPYVIIDTVKYGHLTNLFDYEIRTKDSNLTVFAIIESYAENMESIMGIDKMIIVQKEKIEAGQKLMKQIIETTKFINTIKVGYLRYLDGERNRYESRIFFFRGTSYVEVMLLEKNLSSSIKHQTLSDCIFDNLEIVNK